MTCDLRPVTCDLQKKPAGQVRASFIPKTWLPVAVHNLLEVVVAPVRGTLLISSACVTLGKCNKDVSGHLKSYKVRDSCVDTEASLLLARAGKFFLPVNKCNQGATHYSLNLVCCLIHFELN